MADARQTHDWNLIAPLICVTANVWLPKNKQLKLEDVHPFESKKARKPKPFDRNNWMLLKSLLRR